MSNSSGPQEFKQMLVDYAKQETIDPLKTLGRYLAFGLSGSIFVSLGFFFWGLAILRYSQSLDVFEGSSWGSIGPYGVAFGSVFTFLVVLYLFLARAKRKVL